MVVVSVVYQGKNIPLSFKRYLDMKTGRKNPKESKKRFFTFLNYSMKG